MNVIYLAERTFKARVRFAAVEIGLVALEYCGGWMLAEADGCTVIAGDDEYGLWSGSEVIEYSRLFQEGQREGMYVV